MKFKELHEMASEDLKLDKTQLDKDSLDTPLLYTKYLKQLVGEKVILQELESQLAVKKRERWEFYRGKNDDSQNNHAYFVDKGDVPLFIDADENIIEIQKKLTGQKEKVKYIEGVLRMLQTRTFQIKNAIEWQQFLNGRN